VRAVTRSTPESHEFKKSLDIKFGPGKVECVEVKDINQPNAWDGLLDGK
jgi:hypothetical protein